jgi:hypothetical protein
VSARGWDWIPGRGYRAVAQRNYDGFLPTKEQLPPEPMFFERPPVGYEPEPTVREDVQPLSPREVHEREWIAREAVFHPFDVYCADCGDRRVCCRQEQRRPWWHWPFGSRR